MPETPAQQLSKPANAPSGDPSTAPAALEGKTLRIALAMRGGVSMAVWIGGAVAELDLMRRAAWGTEKCGCTNGSPELASPRCPAPGDERRRRAHLYRQMLDSAGFGPVEFDILAGASAGGLNAILYALTQSYGVVSDRTVGRMWSNDGDLWDLIRDQGWGSVPSLLDGDGRFLALATDTLNKIGDAAKLERAPQQDQIAVELAATLLTDGEQRLGNRANFSFARRPGGLKSAFSTIPGAPDAADDAPDLARRRMALAARSTSSFPGAFEPAAVHSVLGADATGPVRTDGGELVEGSAKDAVVNMVSVFPFARQGADGTDANERLGRPVDTFKVIDGGVFDNIPIDRALRAIQRAPASDPSERHLIYLDPQPPRQDESPAAPVGGTRGADAQTASSVSWLSVVLGAKKLQKREESAADEVAQIWRYNASETQVRDRMNALGGFGSPADGVDFGSEAGYLDCRIGNETERIGELLADPVAQMCSRPFDSRPYPRFKNSTILPIRREVLRAYGFIDSYPADGSIPMGPSPEEVRSAREVYRLGDVVRLGEACRILIAWVQQLQRLGDEQLSAAEATPALRDLKAGLYRCLTVLREGRRITTDAMLVSLPAGGPDDEPMSTRMIRGIARQDGLWISTGVAGVLAPEPADVAEEEFYAALAAPGSGVTGIGVCEKGAPTPPPGSSLLACLRTRLVDYLSHVQAWAVVNDNGGDAADPDLSAWNESLFAAIRGMDLTIAGITRLCAQSGIPNTASTVRFTEITGDTTPRAAFPKLVNAAIDSQLETWLRAGTDPAVLTPERRKRAIDEAEQLKRADVKLAGTVLARFGGFLDAGWRRNDWCWGRLDAAAGVVELLMKPAVGKQVREQAIRDLQSEIQKAPEGDCSADDAPPSETVLRVIDTVSGETIDNLPIGYRFGVVARTVPLLLRALWPAESSAGGIQGLSTRIALLAVRPLVPVVTLAADLLRLVAAVGVAMLAATLLGSGATKSVGQGVFVTLLAAAGGYLLWRRFRVHKRWSRVRAAIYAAPRGFDTTRPERWQSRVTKAWPRARNHQIAAAALAVVLIAIGTAWWINNFAKWVDADTTLGIGLEFMVLATVGVVLALWYLNAESLKVRTVPPKRGGWRLFLIGATWVIFAGTGIFAYFAAANGECVRQMMNNSKATCDSRFAHVIVDWIPGYDTAGYAGFVAAAAVLGLTLLSFTFWANWWFAILAAAGLAILAGLLQWWFEHVFHTPILDLLPIAVWMVGVGVTQQWAPKRQLAQVASQRDWVGASAPDTPSPSAASTE
ncbi:DUF3376 domain-containing protein [Gordonia sp. NPDC003585]|uniref:DUF3376 domain-containing protein n=1 Tax=Gordonia sp. NPDC003585 TaxID=3154275 RepID=UPI0033B96915